MNRPTNIHCIDSIDGVNLEQLKAFIGEKRFSKVQKKAEKIALRNELGERREREHEGWSVRARLRKKLHERQANAKQTNGD